MSKTISVGNGAFQGDSNLALQQAVDAAAAAGGGTVEVPAGVYRMRDALHLRSGVQVVGEAGAILRKVPSVSSALTNVLGYGHYEFTVAEPEKFEVGMGVHVTDKGSVGFYDTVGTITHRQGELFFIDRKFNHDYSPTAEGCVTSVFSLIQGYRVHDAGASGLTLDGNPEETVWMNGCRGGGVFLLEAHGVELRDLEITNYRGDGVSFQQCTDIIIRGCHVHHQTGGGLHPGSGSVRYLLEDNNVHDNGGCGVFYCLRTTHSICRNNTLLDNGDVGISIGERDTDHQVCGNTIRGNGGSGVAFRPPRVQSGDRVRLEDNCIGPNCRGEAEHEIVVPDGLRQVLIAGNEIAADKGKALAVGADCGEISFAGNTVNGRAQTPEDIEGQAADNTDADFPDVGPAALPLDGARHLNMETLTPWQA